MNELTQLIDPNYHALSRIYLQCLRVCLAWYAGGHSDDGQSASHMLKTVVRDPQSDCERHLVTYLRWYAAGNQDGGACARVALEIAS